MSKKHISGGSRGPLLPPSTAQVPPDSSQSGHLGSHLEAGVLGSGALLTWLVTLDQPPAPSGTWAVVRPHEIMG